MLDHEYNFSLPRICDHRGVFCKPFIHSTDIQCKEVFYTRSKKGVARGLHYQDYPKPATRILNVISGSIIDFIVHFDPDSNTIINYTYAELESGGRMDSAYIPGDGCHCHGFIALEDSICLYISSEEYSPDDDKGYDLFSLPYSFSNLKDSGNLVIIRSIRDTTFPSLH